MGDKRDRYKIPRGVKKEALQGRDLRAMHGYGGGKVTKSINRKLRYQKDVGYKTAVKIDTYYRRQTRQRRTLATRRILVRDILCGR